MVARGRKPAKERSHLPRPSQCRGHGSRGSEDSCGVMRVQAAETGFEKSGQENGDLGGKLLREVLLKREEKLDNGWKETWR